MYVGRIVAVGCTQSGKAAAMYRVSSRSFPNRRAMVQDSCAAIVPKPGFEGDVMKNPYIAYNCLRLVDNIAVATNGSQTDPIAEKIESGMSIRDALVTVLSALDYEKDDYNTPRIAAIADPDAQTGYLGIVRHDALHVQAFELTPGKAHYVCTYEHNRTSDDYCDSAFDCADAEAACRYILGKGIFAEMEKPVSSACAVHTAGDGYEVAAIDASVAQPE
ncbi:MAG: IMP cyclohydrolase [Lentisphaeria bacterium]